MSTVPNLAGQSRFYLLCPLSRQGHKCPEFYRARVGIATRSVKGRFSYTQSTLNYLRLKSDWLINKWLRGLTRKLRRSGEIANILFKWKSYGIFRSCKGKNFLFCKICKVNINVSHGGVSDVRKHLATAKHQQLVKGKLNLSQCLILVYCPDFFFVKS